MKKLKLRWLPANMKKQPVEVRRVVAGLAFFIAATLSLTLILRKRVQIMDKIRSLQEQKDQPIVLKSAGAAA